MLKFDGKGHLKPYEPIPCNIFEFKRIFVDMFESQTRNQNYQNYIRYSSDLKKLLGTQKLHQWINGSFVTKKKNPKDVDLVTFIPYQLIQELGIKLNPFKGIQSWSTYSVDAYIIVVHPQESELFRFTEFDCKEWLYLFTHGKRNRKGEKQQKGFIEIFY